MTQFSDWAIVVLLAGLMVIAFVGSWTNRHWWVRPIFALFALGLLIATAGMLWILSQGATFGISDTNGYAMFAGAVMAWWGAIAYARRPRDRTHDQPGQRQWGCLRIMFATIGALVIGYAMFVILVMGTGLLIGLAGAF